MAPPRRGRRARANDDQGLDNPEEGILRPITPTQKLGQPTTTPPAPGVNQRNRAMKFPDELTETFKAQRKLFETDEGGNDTDKKDLFVCDQMQKLSGKVIDLAKKFPDETQLSKTFYEDLMSSKDNEQLIRYIGCLALGGPNGEKAWQELVTQTETRRALIVGIVGRALKEEVFGDLYFGCSREEGDQPYGKLSSLELDEKFQQQDGFYRTKERARYLKDYTQDDLQDSHGQEACYKITLGLVKMLTPFWNGQDELPHPAQQDLYSIVCHAGLLSRLMRLAPDVVYYWPPTFKDEEFEPARMECLNLHSMITNSPYQKKTIGGIERATLKDKNASNTEAIVKIVCFPGLVSYRQGGGKLAEKELAAEKSRNSRDPPDVQISRDRYGEKITKDNGFRSRIICKGVVFLIWGKQRLLTKEAGTSAHIDAVKQGLTYKYEEDYEKAGYVEFLDVARKRWREKEKSTTRQQDRPSRRPGSRATPPPEDDDDEDVEMVDG